MSNCTCAFPCGGTEEACPSSPGYGQLVRRLLAEVRQQRALLADKDALLLEALPALDLAASAFKSAKPVRARVREALAAGVSSATPDFPRVSIVKAHKHTCASCKDGEAFGPCDCVAVSADSHPSTDRIQLLTYRVNQLIEGLARGASKNLIVHRVFAINEVLWPIAIEYKE